MSQQRWDLPIKAIWGAGSSVRIVFRLRITVACAHTFQTFTGNSVTVRSSTKKESACEYRAVFAVCVCRLYHPGPTNILILANSQHHGVKATLPALVSGCVAASMIVLISGAGAGEILHQHPLVRQVMSWAGVAWLSWMSWQLFSAPATNLSGKPSHRFTARRGAAADSKPENVDDGVGGGESVCADRESRTARYCIDGAVVFAHLYRMFTVLGVAGKGGKPSVSHHRGDGAFSACDGVVFVDLCVGGSVCLGQRPALAALGKAQNVFCQTMRSLHIRMAAIDQHTAQTAFQHQFHLFSHHCRIVNLQRGQQFVSEIVRRAFVDLPVDEWGATDRDKTYRRR